MKATGPDQFYDELSPYYHLIYGDWNASVQRQGQQLARLIRQRFGDSANSVLDVSCGIGTQSLGLAGQGFAVTGSDISPGAVERARREAAARGLDIRFSVCDMQVAHRHHEPGFDIVLSADNSLPHLLSDDDLLSAVQSMYALARPGGGCIVTMRDYDSYERGRGLVHPFGVRDDDGVRYLVWQVWDFDGDYYDFSMYFLADPLNGSDVETRVMRSRYYAVSIDTVVALMQEAGFEHIERFDDAFFQPVIVAGKPD